MIKKKCVITGARGFLGLKLTQYFNEKGWEVVPLSSKSENSNFLFDLRNLEKFKGDCLENCNLLIHAAYDFSTKSLDESFKINIEGSEKLFKLAKNKKVEKIINISTLSSFANAKSIYGKTKFKIEVISKKYNIINLRVGLLFGGKTSTLDNLKNISNNLPVIPLIGKGYQKLHMCHYEDLMSFIFEISKKEKFNTNTVYFCCSKQFIYFKDLINNLSKKRKIFLPIPLFVFSLGLKIIQKIGLRMKFNIDNLNGLINYSDEINFNNHNKYFRSINE